jgi:CRP-like cAMP-binding protein
MADDPAGAKALLASPACAPVAIGEASLASRTSSLSGNKATESAPIASPSVGAQYASLQSLSSDIPACAAVSTSPQTQRDISTTPGIRAFNNRLITSDVTAQALAAAMVSESLRTQNVSATRALRISRRHSAREDTSQQPSALSSRSDSNTPRTMQESSVDAIAKRSLDAEEGAQQLRMKAAAILRDKITVNRMGVKRMALASGNTPASLFAAAVLAVSAASSGDSNNDMLTEQDNELAGGEQYEQMMERFQLRRLQRTLSSHSNSSIDQSEVVTGAKSARVTPAPIFGEEEESGEVVQVGGPGQLAETAEDSGAQIVPSTNLSTALAPNTTLNKPATALQYDPATARPLPNLSLERGRGPQTYRETNAMSQSEVYTARNFGSGVSGRCQARWNYRMRRMRRRLVQRLSTPISPYSRVFAIRSAIMLVACSVQIVYSPYQISFFSETGGFADWTAGLEMLFFVDFALSFNTSAIDKRGTLVTSRPEIAYRYIGSWGIPHLLASFPLSTTLSWATDEDSTQLRWLHFVHVLFDCSIRMQQVVQILQLYHRMGKLHVGRSSKSIWGWLLYSRFSHLMRLTWMIIAILLIAHYLACAWKLLQLPTSPIHVSDHAPLQEYTACFYGAMQLLEGQGLDTETLAQNVFSSIAVLLGSVVLAIIYGHVTMLVSNFNANATSYQRKMEVVFAIMDKMQLPGSLRERIHQYYQHLWREYESLDGEIVKFSKDLTHNLALEVSLFKYMELTMHVPFWRKCSPDFQKQLVLSLQVRVYLPDDFVMRRGEVSNEFYMINRGVCEIVRGKGSFEHCTTALRPRRPRSSGMERIHPPGTQWSTTRTSGRSTLRRNSDVAAAVVDTNKRVFDTEMRHQINRSSHGTGMLDETRQYGEPVPETDTTTTRLGRGQAFGEAALLLNYPRTANARAVTYVEMCILDREAFQSILTRHPDDRKHVMEQMLTWLIGNNEFHHVTCPLRQLVRDVFGESEPGGANGITASRAADLLTAAIDPLVEADSAVLFGTGLEKQLGSIQAKELTARAQHTPARVPVCSSESCLSSVCCCTCCTSSHTAMPVMTHKSDSLISTPVDLRRTESGDRASLSFSLDSTDRSQAETIQLVGKICGSVVAGATLKPTSTPALTPTPRVALQFAGNFAPALQSSSTPAYSKRRLSITRKRSASTPLFDEQGVSIPENAPASLSVAETDSSSPSTNLTPLSTRLELKPPTLRRDSVGGPLLRQMTSLIGFSRSGPTSTVSIESPTRLADQLFQHHDQASPSRTLMRAGTFHNVSRTKLNG